MTPRTRSSHAQRGSVMILVMTLLAALLAAAGTMLYLQTSHTRAVGLASWSTRSLYCAEAGMAAAVDVFGERYTEWPTLLDGDPGNDPTWYPLEGDLDGDGEPDYRVTVHDNSDELPPLADDPLRDNDMHVYVVSRCIHHPDTPREVTQLLAYTGGGGVYRHQAGAGPSNTGNKN